MATAGKDEGTMRSTIAALVLAIAGCGGVSSPQSVVEFGRRYPIKSAKPPAEVASCIIRNAELTADYYHGIQRRSAQMGTLEVEIRLPKAPVAVARLSAEKPSGTTGALWIYQTLGVETLKIILMDGC